VRGVHGRVKGSYAVIVLIAGHGLLAFRDPFGIRPLCLGEDASGSQMLASESVALEGTGHKLIRDIAPGEAVFIDIERKLHAQQCADVTSLNPCIFEFVYLARPDSVMDGISVYQARLNMGTTLAKRVISTVSPDQIDVVIPIPESSRPSAMQLAQLMGKPYREGFVKNRYVGRTFIMPGQAMRKKSVRQKLNAIASEFAGKSVLLVDDSIVRGTTSQEIVQMAREAGAKKVFLASAAPPVRYPNVYGIDMPSSTELVANGRSVAQIEAQIGCDALIYQDLDAMRGAISALNPTIQNFDASCFDGVYVTGDIDTASIAKLNENRT
jgi:amidophosphoribosyltransferase